MSVNSPIKDFNDLVKRLEEIKRMGFVRTHRIGPTGIGKTLEDLLGIEENNIPGPNAKRIELKSARKKSKSMLTLFTKSPLPRGANSVLLQRFGYYARTSGGLDLHTTVNALSYNTLRGGVGFIIEINKDRVELVSQSSTKTGLSAFLEDESKDEKEVLGYWDEKTLQTSFERKLPKLLYIKADCKGSGKDEEFWFNEGWLLSGFDFENFLNLLKEGKILVDIRIGQYSNGRPHDHGTGFRVFPDNLDLCFSYRDKVI